MFRGRFELKLDEKGRLSLPSSFRGLLAKERQLVTTNSYSKGYKFLDVYTLNEWQKLEKRISKLSSLKAEVMAFQRFYLSGGQETPPDKSNRVLIPQSLRHFAELGDEIVVVGMGIKFEVWSKKQWEKYYGSLTANFDQTLAVLAEMDSDE